MGDVTEGFMAAARKVDVLAVSDRILRDPGREASRASTAEVYAFAAGMSALGRIVQETHTLMQVIRWPAGLSDADQQRRRDILETQVRRVEELLHELDYTPPTEPEGASL